MTPSPSPDTSPDPDPSAPVALLVLLQAVVSAASLVVEIVAGRMLAPYVGMSLYTWTAIIAVVLAGFSAGHWAGGLLAERSARTSLTATAVALAGAAVTTALAALLLRWSAGPVITALTQPIASITALSMIVFFLPSFFAGVPAPVLARLAVAADLNRAGRALGAMFAAGAIGAIAGTLLAGFVFISHLGSLGTLTVVTVTYCLAATLCVLLARPRPVAQVPVGLALLAALGLGGAGLSLDNPCTRESDYFCIRVVDAAPGADSPVKLMVLDHLVHGISARDTPDVQYTLHAAMLELIARHRMDGRPFSSFFIGGGTYSIPRSWSARPGLDVTVAEIDPVVTEVAASEFWFDPRTVTILHEDARRALATRPNSHDVIIGDAFTDITVPQHLVTREFFHLVRQRLTPEGVFLMNVIDHVDRLEALAAITTTLRSVFPVVELWAARAAVPPDGRLVFILVAGATPTDTTVLAGLKPEPFEAGRLSDSAVSRMVSAHHGRILTDDFAPIDRMMALRE